MELRLGEQLQNTLPQYDQYKVIWLYAVIQLRSHQDTESSIYAVIWLRSHLDTKSSSYAVIWVQCHLRLCCVAVGICQIKIKSSSYAVIWIQSHLAMQPSCYAVNSLRSQFTTHLTMQSPGYKVSHLATQLTGYTVIWLCSELELANGANVLATLAPEP